MAVAATSPGTYFDTIASSIIGDYFKISKVFLFVIIFCTT